MQPRIAAAIRGQSSGKSERLSNLDAWDGCVPNRSADSVPPHVAAKAAERIDPGAAERLRWNLFDAYFQHNRDITHEDVLRSLWEDAGLPAERLAEAFQGDLATELLEGIVAEHREAVRHGVSGVPAVRRADGSGVLVGAQPTEAYRRWLRSGE